MLYYVYFSDAGTPKTGLTPDWESLLTASAGTDKSGSAPAIAEVGGGWYKFQVLFGVAPWNVVDEDLVGVIDGGDTLSGADRYKSVVITLRGLGLARLAHKRDWSEGDEVLYETDGSTAELELARTTVAGTVTLTPAAAP